MNQWTLPKHHVILFIQYLSLFAGPDEQQVQANHHLPLGHPFESISGVHITRMWPIFNICPDLLALMNNRSRPTNLTPRKFPWINQWSKHNQNVAYFQYLSWFVNPRDCRYMPTNHTPRTSPWINQWSTHNQNVAYFQYLSWFVGPDEQQVQANKLYS